MQTTSNLGLKKPEGTDVVNISDLNSNADILDVAVAGKQDKITGKQLSTEDFTTAEKNKLAGIAAGAQVNTVTSVAGKTGAVTLAKSDVGLGNVDNAKQATKTEFDAHKAEKAQKHITESGSNANGVYIRFDDGTQITISNSIDISGGTLTALGSIYYYTAPFHTYPASFISVATPIVTVYRDGGTIPESLGWGTTETIGSTTGVTPIALKHNNTTFVNTRIRVIALGRWK